MSDERIAFDVSVLVGTWSRAAAGSCAVVAVFLLALDVHWTNGPTGGFLAGVTVVVALELLVLWWALWRSARWTADPRLTVATWLTILRGGALTPLGGFLVVDGVAGGLEWVPALCFAVAAGLDAVDGLVARRQNAETVLGATLDREIDALVVLVGATLVVVTGLAPAVVLLVGLARYVFGAGVWFRRRRGRGVDALPPSTRRRVLGATQVVAIWIALLPIVGSDVSRPMTVVVMVPFLLGFVRDWTDVTGRP